MPAALAWALRPWLPRLVVIVICSLFSLACLVDPFGLQVFQCNMVLWAVAGGCVAIAVVAVVEVGSLRSRDWSARTHFVRCQFKRLQEGAEGTGDH